ncbi:MutS-related protein [Dyadobacter luticola]|uniref:DNA mismatch repair protein MutS n=1 Tax=Dyadobacter luticola TaxID=1979387 RepID=A0A5R9KVR4_9BACT|nr:DNA mismatch repair protein MutS [Dyadobacter luticola]TLV00245.1 DNA mismatch repair protein MutS [Dyadobacter luticola]
MENNIEVNQSSSQVFFETELNKARQAEAGASEQFAQLSVARVAIFLLIIGLAWIWNRTEQNFWGIGVALLLVVFLFLMKKHQRVRRTRDFQKNLTTVNEDELERLGFRFKRTDTGVQHQEKDHAYATDLDIFGEYSLYKLLNRTRTSEGSRRLANWLKNHAAPDEISKRQQASSNFTEHPHLMQEWEATALLHEAAAGNVGVLRAWVAESLATELAAMLRLRWFAVITIIIAILITAGIIPTWVLLISFLVNGLILRRFLPIIQDITNRTGSLGKTLVAYGDLLKNAEAAPFQSAWWAQRRTLIDHSARELNRIGQLFERLDYRNNPFFSLLIGLPTLWDLHCLAAIENWKKANHTKLLDWLDVLADIEAMNSLAGHAFANPECVTPNVLSQEAVFIKTTAMGHPLIPAQKRVSNDFGLEGTGHTMLVTGSNMSGKSTFLRTIGLNLVLAQMGAVVSATAFSCSPVRIFSSMRTQDSLEESTSSFYAELKRLRKLLELADENASSAVFYLLDEILKGTNSADRHRGAEALIRQLHAKNASGLVSTHDLELGEWGATENYVHNFHFRSDVENGQLHFDYRLYEGICRSFNASELMRMMGINIDLTNKPLPK